MRHDPAGAAVGGEVGGMDDADATGAELGKAKHGGGKVGLNSRRTYLRQTSPSPEANHRAVTTFCRV